jgi:DNA polymerase-3 subunit beta
MALIIKVNRQEFLKGLRTVEKAISENKIRPIISCAYLEACNGEIMLKGTNLELTISTVINGEIVQDGRIVFSYQLIEEYLREIGDETIQLVEDGGRLVIETSDSASEFSTFDPEEFPKTKDMTEEEAFLLNTQNFAGMLEKTKFAAAASSDNLAINCVRLEFDEDKLKMISTDTYRLVYLEEELENTVNKSVSLPLNTVDAIIKIFRSEKEETFSLKFLENQILFEIGETRILSRVIDLSFPDYQGILESSEYDKTAVVDTDEFIKVLKRVIIFVKNNAESKYSATFEFKNNLLEINGISETAKINEKIEVEKTGEDLKISLNVKFLLDYLQCLDKDKSTVINLLSSSSAVQLKNVDNEKFLYLAMPLALRED